MTRCEWIICERSGRWAAALRVHFARQVAATRGLVLHETRSPRELDARLAEKPNALVLVEAWNTNLAATLAWLAAAHSSYPTARFVALLDGGSFTSPERPELEAVFLAAGAAAIAFSPRKIQPIFDMARRHTALLARTAPGRKDQPLSDWALELLPWQRP